MKVFTCKRKKLTRKLAILLISTLILWNITFHYIDKSFYKHHNEVQKKLISHNSNNLNKLHFINQTNNKFFIYNFPKEVDTLSCQYNSTIEPKKEWRIKEWTVDCGNNSSSMIYFPEEQSVEIASVNYLDGISKLQKELPIWNECISNIKSSCNVTPKNFFHRINYRPVKSKKLCDCIHNPSLYETVLKRGSGSDLDSASKSNSQKKIIIIKSNRLGDGNIYHDLVISPAGAYTWCLFGLLTHYLNLNSTEHIILHEPNTFIHSRTNFSFFALLMKDLSSLSDDTKVSHFTDEADFMKLVYQYYQSTRINYTIISIETSKCYKPILKDGIIPSFHTFFPNLKPFHEIMQISANLKQYLFQHSQRYKQDAECINSDCILIIQRASRYGYRKIVGSEHGTFSEIILELLSRNLPIRIATFENLTALEQISLFHHAKLVIGVHGAALTNILFMDTMLNSSAYSRRGVLEITIEHGWSAHLDLTSGLCYYKCDSKYYHKFDYFNLAKIVNVTHVHYSPIYSTPPGLNSNAVAKHLFYINTTHFANVIERFYYNLLD